MQSTFTTITPLGGVGEIGLNCQLWEGPQGIVMVDCGLMFPDDSHLGIDIIIPSFEHIHSIRERILGIVLTHGHEDHIGALPWLVPLVRGIKIYGSAFTLALVEHKLRERGLLEKVELVVVKGDIYEDERPAPLIVGDFSFRFFPVCHSIPEGFALAAQSPVGKILHTGDFKIDPHPLEGSGTDIRLFEEFAGEEGVRLLLSDSTNVERDGRTLPEREVKAALEKIVESAPKRVIITLFSSHIHRIQEVFDIARTTDRAVVISGKSLANNIEKAKDLGFIRMPPAFYNAHNGVPDIALEKTILLVTGAQGEPLSALSRMVMGGHKQLSVQKGDTIIMSSRMIPGNARTISAMINEMYRLGAEVYYENVRAIHASGHAHKEELKDILHATRPQNFVPIHGEYRHLVKHCRLAQECGVPESNTYLLEDGDPLTLLPDTIRREAKICADRTLVDGKGVGDVGHAVLRERQILGGEGIVFVILVIDSDTGKVLLGPDVRSKGFIFELQLRHLLEDAQCLVLDQLEEVGAHNITRLHDGIRASLRRFFRRVVDRDPIVVPIISVV